SNRYSLAMLAISLVEEAAMPRNMIPNINESKTAGVLPIMAVEKLRNVCLGNLDDSLAAIQANNIDTIPAARRSTHPSAASVRLASALGSVKMPVPITMDETATQTSR